MFYRDFLKIFKASYPSIEWRVLSPTVATPRPAPVLGPPPNIANILKKAASSGKNLEADFGSATAFRISQLAVTAAAGAWQLQTGSSCRQAPPPAWHLATSQPRSAVLDTDRLHSWRSCHTWDSWHSGTACSSWTQPPPAWRDSWQDRARARIRGPWIQIS